MIYLLLLSFHLDKRAKVLDVLSPILKRQRSIKRRMTYRNSLFIYIHVDERRGHILLLKHDEVAGQVCQLQHTEGPVGQGNSLGRETLRMNTKLERNIFLKKDMINF